MFDLKISFQDKSEMINFLTLYKNINLYNTSNDRNFKEFMESNIINPIKKILKKEFKKFNINPIIDYVSSLSKKYKHLEIKTNKKNKTIEVNHKDYDSELFLSLDKESGSISVYTASDGDGEDVNYYSTDSLEKLKKDIKDWMKYTNEIN